MFGLLLLTSALYAQDPGISPQPTLLEGEERRAFLDRIERAMAPVESIVATFEQRKTLRLLKRPLVTTGVIAFSRPDSLRWDITKPFESTLVVVGEKVAKFETVDGKRRKLELGRRADALALVMDRIRSWFLGRFEEDSEAFEVQVIGAPACVRLVPKSATWSRTIRAIALDIGPKLDRVRKVTIEEREGDFTEITFKLVGRHVEFVPKVFSLTAPVALSEKAWRLRAAESQPKKSSDEPMEKPDETADGAAIDAPRRPHEEDRRGRGSRMSQGPVPPTTSFNGDV